MNSKALFLIFVSILAGLNLGTVRKSEDPIRDTQTNPILYQQKLEEEKDGKKGALLYHVKNNPRESFFIDPPFEKEKKPSSKEAVTENVPSSAETSGWWEEQSTESPEVSPKESVSEPLPEPAPEAAKIQDLESAGQPAEMGEEATPSGKAEDTWW